MSSRLTLTIAIFAYAAAAQAQSYPDSLRQWATDYGPCAFGGNSTECPASFETNSNTYFNVQKFEGSTLTNAGYLSVTGFANSIYSSVMGPLSQQLTSMSMQMQRNTDRLSEGIAIASALTVIAPNPGDRFSLTVGGSGFNGMGAGAITATARLTEDTILYAGYGRSQTQSLVKGGLSFSFR